ncbi:15-hydroxyprostaglandin dehydrogenase [NAD(+)]-like [Belonocnema kinseyi]|uniref:15-hydroxyprostaglandin dehydrogenase [NAD(+)]-like n=1 Tax=Belonocnema kinseyi TaxID=2817044 RepID=UPI00143D82D6|nr:15-hydroxyprostaglandin dehydrogenase [NAD(+)]-like [Belonocnema kinseyi]
MNIKGKTALITGGANGIGYLYAKELLRNGLKCVYIMDLPNSEGDVAVTKLEAEFGKSRAVFLVCDVSKAKDFELTFKEVLDACKDLDILINNAGIMNDSRWEFMIDLNLKALVRGTLMAIDHMGKHKGGKGGTVVNIASTVGLNAYPYFPVYCATKHAVIGFSSSIQELYEKTCVRILTMCPAVTITALITECANKALEIMDKDELIADIKKRPSQSAEHVARALMDLIEKGDNGAIWVCAKGEPPYAIKRPTYSDYRIFQ